MPTIDLRSIAGASYAQGPEMTAPKAGARRVDKCSIKILYREDIGRKGVLRIGLRMSIVWEYTDTVS